MELIFVLAAVLFQVLFINLFEVMQVAWAPVVDAFVEDEVFLVLFGTRA